MPTLVGATETVAVQAGMPSAVALASLDAARKHRDTEVHSGHITHTVKQTIGEQCSLILQYR